MKNFSNRIPSLDGLRTISIALVIAGHFAYVLHFDSLGTLGNLGVRVFFIISGSLITNLLLGEIGKTGRISLSHFYFRRTLRIFPPYYFYLLIVFLASLSGIVAVKINALFFAAIYITDYVNPNDWLLGHTWSLSVEEQFYLIFPGVLLLLGLRKTKILLGLLLILCPFLRLFTYLRFGDEPIWIIKGFHANMDALAIGCLLALFYKRLHQNAFYQRILRSNLILLLPPIILALNFTSERPRVFLFAAMSLMNLLTAVFIDWAVTNFDSLTGRFLNSAPMVKLGAMSYSIYLWQQPFFNPHSESVFARAPYNFLGLAVMTLISFYLVERYSLKLRKILEKRFLAKKQTLGEEATMIRAGV